ncbi:MAG: hypothetical protein COS99_04495 [Candidatus Omnitrophica bacterium CG07_land_8_20_14_0_80_42_15]|uniref:SHS2 domain-containing protein n=1 Tax=Candidatus Aquitaenariimonas noxiae TaxID=1974741 RepID=A0A2J0L2U8_9BACT|nr:MAG: hypothetical protein COS99_04495 [Candidatus Omnitrophica bacterium CG07_land_8_20_14_0_80_42_15]
MAGKKNKKHIGLDIGSSSLKIMEVSSDKEVRTIENIGVQELPAGPLEETLPSSLKTLIENTGITAKEVNISISGSAVVVRFVELPIMQPSELSQAVSYEAEKYMPFDMNEIILDYAVLEKDQASKKMKIILVGAKKDFVEKRIKLIEEAGLAPNIIDVDSFAIFNSFINNVNREERGSKTVALLNMGAHLTSMIIASGDVPWMVRDINLGDADLTQVLKEKLDIDTEEAERLKENPGERASEILGILMGIFQKLIDEVRLSFNYYENQYGKGVDEVYVSGGSIKIEGLIPFLKESTGMEFKQWDPLSSFTVNPKIPQGKLDKIRSLFAVCSGLTLRK